MKEMLFGGFGLFFLSQCVHICIWRIKIPTAYPIWLFSIFVALPTVVLGGWLGWLAFMGSPLLTGDLLVTAMGAYLLHGSLSGVYAIAYPGIVHFSPTVEIAKAIASGMPHGQLATELNLPLFTPRNMLDLRLDNLLKAGMIQRQNEGWAITPKGARIAGTFVFFRRLLGLPELGGG